MQFRKLMYSIVRKRGGFLKVLVVPMSAMAETAGSFMRATLLVKALKEVNIETAVCMAEDVN